MNSASSTESRVASRDAGMQPWHLFLLLAMAAATWAVIESQNIHPAALLVLSAAILAAGGVAIATYKALAGFLKPEAQSPAPLSTSARQALEDDKALVLRSIKELEFDRAMRKVSDADFAEIGGRLRARAMDLMEQLDRPTKTQAPPVPKPVPSPARVIPVCGSCGTENDVDARFCKSCGAKLA